MEKPTEVHTAEYDMDFEPQPPPGQELPPPPEGHPTLANSNVKVESLSGASVVQRHLDDLDLIPPAIQRSIRARGVSVVVGNAAVPFLDEMRHLAVVHPRGWDPGKTWAQVAGMYDPNSHQVILGRGENGSISLALHEYAHAISDVHDVLNRGAIRQQIRMWDTASLLADPYHRQGGLGGTAGAQEMFAESFAIYFVQGREVLIKKTDLTYVQWLEELLASISRDRLGER